MNTPEDRLEASESLVADMADELEASSGIDRRQFMFYSLVAAAASSFGVESARAQGAPLPAPEDWAPTIELPASLFQPPIVPPLALGNGEAPALQFQAYPGGTGALMEKLARERGRAAFDRSVFTVEKFSGAMPASDEDIAYLPAHRLSALLKQRKITSARLTAIYLERIKRLNPTLLCAVTIMEDSARAEAAKADAEIAAGKYRGPLHGLPYGVKDLFSTKGVPTTWGAADFENRIIDEDAEIVVRLRDAGAVLIAKLATGLFAQNDQWFRGRTNNPWNLNIGSSGSSAGPASATAAGCVAFSIGTETQGSIVSPSIRCGLSALRPTFGRTSRHGGMVLAWSQDRVGPICRSIEDCAMVFNAYHGVDEKDPSTLTTPFQFDRALKLSSLRIGVDPNAPKELVEKLKALGMTPKDVGPRPTVPGVGGGGLNVEYAAAFDSYVQRKAKEIGLDLTALPEPAADGRGNNAPFGNPPPNTSPMAPADWNPRFVGGRTARAFEFMQNQRRRMVLVAKWGEYMKDLDLFIGGPNADVGPNAQTGHPCAVVPYKFDVPQFGGGGGGRGGGGRRRRRTRWCRCGGRATATNVQAATHLRGDHRQPVQRRHDPVGRTSISEGHRLSSPAPGVVGDGRRETQDGRRPARECLPSAVFSLPSLPARHPRHE
ncbi:MAG: amidase [Gemmatimonadaceae bacterium]|nr:amidase [Gemmatimonadaceae bacterium]